MTARTFGDPTRWLIAKTGKWWRVHPPAFSPYMTPLGTAHPTYDAAREAFITKSGGSHTEGEKR